MALQLTARAELLSQRRNVEPNLIIEIEDVPTLYSTIVTLKIAKYGDAGIYFGMPGLLYGGGVEDPNIKSLISLAGSGSTITQQLRQDRGSATSVSSLAIELVDKDGIISKLVSPGVIVDELLAKRAVVYLNFKDGFHPQDSIAVHRGIIDQITPKAGSATITIASPEQLKRQEIFLKQETQTTLSALAADTTITVNSTDGFIDESTDNHTSYIQIEDEIIRWTGKTDTTFTGLTRGALGTVAANHDNDSTVNSFYRLQGDAIDLALKLMLSGPEEYFETDIEIENIGGVSVTNMDPSVVFFQTFDAEIKYGLVAGDMISIEGSASNDVVDAFITGFGKDDTGSWITTDQTFTWEPSTTGVAKLKSKYNTLAEGMRMTPYDVDVPRHQDLLTRFSSSIPDYDFYLKDTITAKDFLAEEVYFPAGLYSLPRNTKASLGITVPPIADTDVITLTGENVPKASTLSSERSINKNFYNAIVIKYNELPGEEKFINGKVTYSASAQERFKAVGNKPMTIMSKGLRPSGDTETLIRTNSRRWLERYENAAQTVPKVNVLFKEGFKVEVGDTVIFGSSDLKFTDINSGSRDTQPQLYEVQNKSLNIKTGEVTLDLLSTNFAIDGRYGVVSPSTLCDSGSTTTMIKVKDSFSTAFPKKERDKWKDYVGLTILIHSADWTYAEETVFNGFSPTDDYAMLVDTLPSPPAADYIIDIPAYPLSTDPRVNSKYKILHCFFDPQVEITSGVDNFSFNVAGGDVTKFFVGSILRIHSDDYLVDSEEVLVTDITGTLITVEDDLGFTPSAGDKVDLIGFADHGNPYRYI